MPSLKRHNFYNFLSKDVLIRVCKESDSLTEVAEKFGVSRSTIVRTLERHGLSELKKQITNSKHNSFKNGNRVQQKQTTPFKGISNKKKTKNSPLLDKAKELYIKRGGVPPKNENEEELLSESQRASSKPIMRVGPEASKNVEEELFCIEKELDELEQESLKQGSPLKSGQESDFSEQEFFGELAKRLASSPLSISSDTVALEGKGKNKRKEYLPLLVEIAKLLLQECQDD